MAEARFSDAPPNRRPVTLELDPDEALAILILTGKGKANFDSPINGARHRVYDSLYRLLGKVGYPYQIKNAYASDSMVAYTIQDEKGNPA